jgi:hypothetical protein
VVLSLVPIDACVELNESAIPDTPPLALALMKARELEETEWKLAHELVPSVLNVAVGPVPDQVASTVKEAGNPELLPCGHGGVVESIDTCSDAL